MDMKWRRAVYFVFLACILGGMSSNVTADDTEMFGAGKSGVLPNVLIIFDNSGSMNEEIVTGLNAFDPTKDYSGIYLKNWVYYTTSAWDTLSDFLIFLPDILPYQLIGSNHKVDADEIHCEPARLALNSIGWWKGVTNDYFLTNTAPCYRHGCRSCWLSPAYEKTLFTGNYLNYLKNYREEKEEKLSLAKKAVTGMIRAHYNEARFGVMIFNEPEFTAKWPLGPKTDSQGGRVIAPLKDRTLAETEALCGTINGITTNAWTPLAETLAEAGLYYAAQKSAFNSGVDYATKFSEKAIQWRCQRNYVIIMTDGESTTDEHDILHKKEYLHGDKIGDFDGDGADNKLNSQKGSHYLDDVAKFLYEKDLIISDTLDASETHTFHEDGKYKKQNVQTYTIGFEINDTLLERTADLDHGHGRYLTTADASKPRSLPEIFETIMNDIKEESSAGYASPVVPINRANRTYADNGLYIALFSPSKEEVGTWTGNLKKFGLDSDGTVKDVSGNNAVDSSGAMFKAAKSAWGTVNGDYEGMNVELGGAGAALLKQGSRKFLTNSGTGLINFGKDTITYGNLNLAGNAEKDDLIDFVTGQGVYAPGGTRARSWVLGDIIHSEPAILYDYDNNKNVIFVGANDGFMHCFVDDDKGTRSLADDTVTESWAFLPWDLLPNLKHLPSSNRTALITGDNTHDYFVDGSPTLYKSENKKYLAFGLRRGGMNLNDASFGELDNQYFILDVDNYQAPKFVAGIPKNILQDGDGNGEALGQSWSVPLFCKIKLAHGAQDVLLLAGGYDTNQDGSDPGTADTKGRAIFAVNARDGSLVTEGTNLDELNHAQYGAMKYCIVDFRTYDDNDDGYEDVIYAPSVGGELFVFEDKDHDGMWSKRLLFKSAPWNESTEHLRKFFNAPGIAQEPGFDYVFIGSGDREHPLETATVNRFYAIKNHWGSAGTPADSDDVLTDVTDDLLQTSATSEKDKALIRNNLSKSDGWFIDLDAHSGEKVVSTPLVYNKVVYFTTFTPFAVTGVVDKCSETVNSGTARLYALNYKTGESVFHDFDGSPGLTKDDRSLELGGGIPSDPMLVVTEKGTFVLVGTSSGPNVTKADGNNNMHRYYWLKVK